MAYESLHNHTDLSDGTQSYTGVLATAWEHGFGVMAFTDHDLVPTATQRQELLAYDGPVKWLLGCELTSGLPLELGEEPVKGLHLLGLFVDPTNETLAGHCARMRAGRVERLRAIAGNLAERGFSITAEECLAAGDRSTGLPHIVRAVYSRPENVPLLAELMAEARALAARDPQAAERYARLTAADPRDVPYRLFLSDDAAVSGIYVSKPDLPDLDSCVRLIRQAGGIAILAHWRTVWRRLGPMALDGLLRDGRLDGVELHATPANQRERDLADWLARTAAFRQVHATYGLDSHQPGDFDHWLAQPGSPGQLTIGQTARLVEQTSPNLKWSNL